MKSIRRFTFLLLLAGLIASFSPAKRYTKKAERKIEQGDLRAARYYFKRALDKDPDHFRANYGMGLMLSELLDDYSSALPYLENAWKNRNPKDSLYDLLFGLAKCYHHNSDYDKAMALYTRLANCSDLSHETDFQKDLQKNSADCDYAMRHRNDELPASLYIVNAGKTINSDMPEYVPVITPRRQLIFTSKRKDDKKEGLNYIDGKYFESMYVSDISANGFSTPKRFTLPDAHIKKQSTKRHQAVVSLSQDGRTLYTFRDGTIYEISFDDTKKEPEKLEISQDKDVYQNHAFLSRDGNTLYFTSDVSGGFGGNDIYKCSRRQDGKWDQPQNLGPWINTSFDEDAPFLSADNGTLYFSSKGHPGFGNFDLYKSIISNGKYAKPENLGAPFNSPAHDIFFGSRQRRVSGLFRFRQEWRVWRPGYL